MDTHADIIGILKRSGVGRRQLDDVIFSSDKPFLRLGIYDEEVDVCSAVIVTPCTVPGCEFTANSILQFENHYNTLHRYSCSQCKKVLPSPHLLDLHIQEQHDSFFAVMAAKKPSYSCYIEECKEKFVNADERLNHCVKIHKLPRDFRFDHRQKQKSKSKQTQSMDTDCASSKAKKFNFTNSKQKGFQYTGKKFTDNKDSSASVDMDAIMTDLKENLPES